MSALGLPIAIDDLLHGHSIGVSDIHKSKKSGYAVQLDALAQLTGWQSAFHLSEALEQSGSGAAHDRLDAFMSAWIAYLNCIGKAKALGIEPDDVIWVPDIGCTTITAIKEPTQTRIAKPVPKRTVSSECPCCAKRMLFDLPRICPACLHEFKGIGWGGVDAHWRARHESFGVTYEQFRESLCDQHR